MSSSLLRFLVAPCLVTGCFSDGAGTSSGSGQGTDEGDGDGDGDGDSGGTSSGSGEGTGDGDGDGDGTSSGSGQGTGDGDGDGDGDALCGDGVVDDGEACDDGVNAGMAEGDCAPDCSKVVEAKLIRLSQNSFLANFGVNEDNVVAFADEACPVGYKAMFVDGIHRVASVAPLMGNGQADWVIQPWTRYINGLDEEVWTTGELPLLGVDDDYTWAGLINPVVPSVNFGWTGMFGDYTTSTHTCSGWTVTSGADGSAGQAHQISQLAIGPDIDANLFAVCSVMHEFYCVEQ